VTGYNLLEELELQFGNSPEDKIPEEGRDVEKLLAHIEKSLDDREKYCFSEFQRWDYGVNLMKYTGYIMHHQMVREDVSEIQMNSSSFLLDMAINIINDDDMGSRVGDMKDWSKGNRAIMNHISAFFGQVFFDALNGTSQTVNHGIGYEDTLRSLERLKSAPVDTFYWDNLKDVVPDPTIVSESNRLDHLDQRRRYGISEYDIENPRAFVIWMTINGALYSSREDKPTVPSRYPEENATALFRADLLNFVYPLYVFGFKETPLSEDENMNLRRELDNFVLYLRSMSD